MTKGGSHASDRRRIAPVVMLLSATLIVATFGLADPRGELRPWHSLFGPREDGNWAAVNIDGRQVSPRDYRVALFNRKVVGGRDGCNDWAYASEADANGERMVETTLAECPDNDQGRVLRTLAYASKIELLADGKLQLSARGHRATFRRCRWKTVKESGPGWSSEAERCAIQ